MRFKPFIIYHGMMFATIEKVKQKDMDKLEKYKFVGRDYIIAITVTMTRTY